MNEVVIDLAAAIICFASICHPMLSGVSPPRGEFQLQHLVDPSEHGYARDVIVFKETDRDLFCIHKPPGHGRVAKLKSKDPKQRNMVTMGCINVEPEVYDKLVGCCLGSKVIIK